MNIKDVDLGEYDPIEENLFDDMLVRQNQLIHELYAADKIRTLPDGSVNHELVKDSVYRALEEVYEADLCLKNKEWKKTEMLTDEEHFKEEMIDAIHFWLEAMIFRGYYDDISIEEMIKSAPELDIHSGEAQKKIKNYIFAFTRHAVNAPGDSSGYSLRAGLEDLFKICKMAGMDAQEIHDTYIKKWEVNRWRIKTDY